MAGAVHTVAILELSQAAYDEIEAKLLAAGYEHVFAEGPGSLIDMTGIGVERSFDAAHGIKERVARDVPKLIADFASEFPGVEGAKLRVNVPADYKVTR